MSLIEGKHAQIIEAAVTEFTEHGFRGTSMDRVAARADVSKRTVYNHFESKEGLFRAILEILSTEVNQVLDITYDPSRPVRDQLLDLGGAEGGLLTNPDFMRLARLVMGETMRDPALAAEMNARMMHITVFNAFMTAARDDGTLAIDDIPRATEQFLGLIKSQAFWPMIYSGQVVTPDEMDRIIRTSVDMFLGEYGTP
ncbi:MAG: TetR/AcrR family transcriptional regulator [Rhodospirillales bacterium]|nr:TetR/AcrR family transcriptional regulator [Rhodospirillales bacterium]